MSISSYVVCSTKETGNIYLVSLSVFHSKSCLLQLICIIAFVFKIQELEIFQISGIGHHLRHPSLRSHFCPSQVELRRTLGEALGVLETGKNLEVKKTEVFPNLLLRDHYVWSSHTR